MRILFKRMTRKCIASVIAMIVFLMLSAAITEGAEFSQWLDSLREEAVARGISEKTLDRALAGLEPMQRVIELDRNQPESKMTFWQYMKLMVTDSRIAKGRMLLHEHRDLLESVKDRYGVQPRFLVAIWGMETNFGSYLGSFPIIQAVATLAYDERRSEFFRAELLNALQILDEGHIDISEMQGSWAGAMGQVQFMPSTFIRFAVDEDGDGRQDIWRSLPDVFASAANFISSYGWNDEYTWGRKVKVPRDMPQSLYGMNIERPLSEWQASGVRRMNGDDLPKVNITASLIQPAGEKGLSYLVYQNYRAMMRWNRSHFYALAVCHLADRLAGKGT
jgi:membrane-bound lytic murein transglycosylase B